MNEESSNETKRSMRTNNENSVEKFDFDSAEYELDPLKKYSLVSRSRQVETTQVDVHNDILDKKREIKGMILDIRHHELKREDTVETPVDPLFDDKFSLYHKKMLRQESRMLQLDITNGENEADKLMGIADRLHMFNWQPTLLKVTKVKDPSDQNEMDEKRQKTLTMIEGLLRNFESMKQKTLNLTKKNNKHVKKNYPDKALSVDTKKVETAPMHGIERTKIYGNVDRRFFSGYSSSSDEDEESLNIEEIREHRKIIRENQCGKSFTLCLGKNFQPTFAIIAEPLRKPYVVKATCAEKAHWKMIRSNEPIQKLKVYHAPPSLIAKELKRFSIPNTLPKKSINDLNAISNANGLKIEDPHTITNNRETTIDADFFLNNDDSELSDVDSPEPIDLTEAMEFNSLITRDKLDNIPTRSEVAESPNKSIRGKRGRRKGKNNQNNKKVKYSTTKSNSPSMQFEAQLSLKTPENMNNGMGNFLSNNTYGLTATNPDLVVLKTCKKKVDKPREISLPVRSLKSESILVNNMNISPTLESDATKLNIECQGPTATVNLLKAFPNTPTEIPSSINIIPSVTSNQITNNPIISSNIPSYNGYNSIIDIPKSYPKEDGYICNTNKAQQTTVINQPIVDPKNSSFLQNAKEAFNGNQSRSESNIEQAFLLNNNTGQTNISNILSYPNLEASGPPIINVDMKNDNNPGIPNLQLQSERVISNANLERPILLPSLAKYNNNPIQSNTLDILRSCNINQLEQHSSQPSLFDSNIPPLMTQSDQATTCLHVEEKNGSNNEMRVTNTES